MNSDYSHQTSADGEGLNLRGYILSAIDMEDEFTNSVYHDYMNRKNWPRELSDKTLKTILTYLQVLLDDTQRHKNKLLELKKKLSL